MVDDIGFVLLLSGAVGGRRGLCLLLAFASGSSSVKREEADDDIPTEANIR
jgi:hypothetical protein